MRCYNCGCNLTEHNFCTNCKVDVTKYKLVVSASNLFYNDGLEKARVRDLSGAVASLRQCLKPITAQGTQQGTIWNSSTQLSQSTP